MLGIAVLCHCFGPTDPTSALYVIVIAKRTFFSSDLIKTQPVLQIKPENRTHVSVSWTDAIVSRTTAFMASKTAVIWSIELVTFPFLTNWADERDTILHEHIYILFVCKKKRSFIDKDMSTREQTSLCYVFNLVLQLRPLRPQTDLMSHFGIKITFMSISHQICESPEVSRWRNRVQWAFWSWHSSIYLYHLNPHGPSMPFVSLICI